MGNNNFENFGLKKVHRPVFEVLVPAAQNGGKHSMNTICKTFKPLVLSQCHLSTFAPLHEDAIDIAYLSIVRCTKFYHGDTYNHFPGYIKTMMEYDLKNALRKEQRVQAREPLLFDNEQLDSIPSASFEDDLTLMLTESSALKQLPANYRNIIIRHYQLGMKIGQIAEELGVTHQAVSKMKKAALWRLQTILKNM